MNFNKRRAGVMAGGIAAVGALAALSLGGTSALFTSQAGGQTNDITAGTVVLSENSPVSNALNVGNFMPGDTQSGKYALKYQGEEAFVGFDIAIKSVAKTACPALANDSSVTPSEMAANCTATGSQPMFNGAPGSGSLDMSITPYNGNTYGPLILSSVLESATACSADGTGLLTCTAEKANIPIPPGYIVNPVDKDLVWTNGQTDSINVQAKLPIEAPNMFQGSNVKIDLVAHAVQFANNNATKGSGLVDSATTYGYSTYGATMLFPKSWS